MGALTAAALRAALAASVASLLREASDAGLPTAQALAERLGELR